MAICKEETASVRAESDRLKSQLGQQVEKLVDVEKQEGARKEREESRRRQIVSADEVERLFRMIDENDDGSLSLEGFQLACLLSTGCLTASELETIFRELDADGSGAIDLGEFRSGSEQPRASPPLRAHLH